MIRITVQRSPADRQGQDIVDPLLCTVPAALARGTAEVDRSYADRLLVTVECPGLVDVALGALVSVADGETAFTGMVRSIGWSASQRGDGAWRSTRLVIERLV